MEYKENPTKEDLLEFFGKRIRIRKMHQTEAFALMGVERSDINKIYAWPFKTLDERKEAFDKLQAVINNSESSKKEIKDAKTSLNYLKRESISKTACYKLAGNSIVVDVLLHLFRCLFIPNQPEYAKTLAPVSQLTLDL